VKPVSVHNTEFSEQGQGSSASAEAPQDSNMREKSEVKFADTSQTIVPSFALANLSTNSETKFRLNDKIGNTDQKRLEAATVTTATRPTATTATDMSKTFAKNDSDNDNTNHDQIVEELNEEEDKRIALTTTKNSTPQPTIEVSTVIRFGIILIHGVSMVSTHSKLQRDSSARPAFKRFQMCDNEHLYSGF
jgi:hypothetical protein